MKSAIWFILYVLCAWGGIIDGKNQTLFDGDLTKNPTASTNLTETINRLETEHAGQATGWNLYENANMIENRLVDVETGKLIEIEGYETRLYIPVDAQEVSVLCAPGTNRFYLAYYDASRQYMSSEILLVTDGQMMHLPDGCSYVSISTEVGKVQDCIFVQEGQDEVYLVAKEGTKYQSIKKAVAAIEDGGEGTIIVFPGTYKENVKAWGKTVQIIGTDVNECVLLNNSASYYAPPLEIAAGEVRNLTIQAKGKNDGTKPGAYGVHVEDNILYENSLIFRECIIESDSNSAVGMGMRGGCDVQFIHCVLTGKEDGLFCHDGAYKKYSGVQKLSMEDCIIEGREGKYAVRFDSQGVTGAEVYVRFVNNTLVNANNKSSENLMQTRNNGGRGGDENWMGLKNFYLDEESRDNNAEEMNYDKNANETAENKE